jgi:hypothetical protein
MMMVVATVVMAAVMVGVAVMRAVATQQSSFIGRNGIVGLILSTADGDQRKRSE